MKKLSRRETQVLNLLKEGNKNKAIANALTVNEKTISTYILRLRKKIGVEVHKNTYFLVTQARKQGYIS